MAKLEKSVGKTPKVPSFRRTLLLSALVLAILIGGVSLFLRFFTRHNEELAVPDFTSMTLAQAKSVADLTSLRLFVVDSVYIKRLPKGVVYSQNPHAGSNVKKNRRVFLTINSLSSQKVAMPSVVGYSQRQARAVLQSKGLSVGKLIYQEDMATDNVLKQQVRGKDVGEGMMVETETKVDLVLGLNPSDSISYVPFVKGQTLQMARNSIHDNSLNVGEVIYDNTVLDYADSLRAVVYRQDPEPVAIQVAMDEEITPSTSKKDAKSEVEEERELLPAKTGSDITLYVTVNPNRL